MLVLNYSHPLTKDHQAQIESIIGRSISEVREIDSQFDLGQPFVPQIEALINDSKLSATEWQTEPLLIVPPALSSIAIAFLSYLHGLMGHFPDCVRLRQMANTRPPRFEVAEILELQEVRNDARGRRAAMKPSSFDPKFYGCPICDWPLDPTTGEWEDTGGGVTCPCGAFVALPDPPQPEKTNGPLRSEQRSGPAGEGDTG